MKVINIILPQKGEDFPFRACVSSRYEMLRPIRPTDAAVFLLCTSGVIAYSAPQDQEAPVLAPSEDICSEYGEQQGWGAELEPLLRQCVQLIAASPLVARRGIVMDAGANSGEGSVQLACDFPHHTVLAVEPTKVNYNHLNKITAAVPNVQTVWGGLSSTLNVSLSYAAEIDMRNAGVGAQLTQDNAKAAAQIGLPMVHFPTHTVDDLVGTHSSQGPLAFAHWDVEGYEHDVLEGARETIARDRPVFTVESFPLSKAEAHEKLMDLVASLGYTAHEVPESCGIPSDCRNFVVVPNGATNPCEALFAASATAAIVSQ